jgi:hypothetical protein
MIKISQHSIDGLGHQLHGLITLMALHGIRDFYFDGYAYIQKQFSFQHIEGSEVDFSKNYLISVVSKFANENNQSQIYKNHIYIGYELFDTNFEKKNDFLYFLDNAYYLDRLNLSEDEKEKYAKNINTFSKYFINEIPLNKRIKEKSVVMHLRLGDSLKEGRETIVYMLSNLEKILSIVNNKFPDYHIYIHTDEEKYISKYESKNCTIYGKNTKILDVLCDFYNSKILFSTDSSLSIFSSFFSKSELIVENCYLGFKFKGYLSNKLNKNILDLKEFITKYE